MPDDPRPFPDSELPTRSIGPTLSADASSFDPQSPPLLHNGQEFGPYLIVRLLGRGGMGEVYEAEDRDNARRVALKVLSRGLATPADRARFMREGRLAASISHPHTIYVYGTDDIEGVPVIAMELAPGGTLKDVVKSRGQLAPAEAVDAVLQVIDGLDAAAEVGVLHRDIKPSNCFVDADGTVKVGDFGLSISTQAFDERSLTMLGTVLGTPGFSSPEQLRGDDLDVRSDIYSVGATLYYLVTGKAPFEDGNVIKLVTRVAQEMPPSPKVVRPEVPDELAGVILQCLAKKPEERFATYDALRVALAPFSSSAPAPAPLGIRFVAGLVDNVLVAVATIPVMAPWWDSFAAGNRRGMLLGTLSTWVAMILYYGIAEGRWGRTLGKHLFGLRVVDLANQRLGVVRGVGRAAAWILVSSGPVLAYSWTMAPLLERYRDEPLAALVSFSFSLVSFATLAAVFAPARRANGYAAVHDRLTSSRVILKRQAVDRRRAAAAASTPLPVARRERLGPYTVLDEHPLGTADVVTGYDDRLRRKVWLHKRTVGDPAVAADRRAMARPTRLRWLAGRRSADEAWDAYEAGDGTLLAAASGPYPWSELRHVLLDLATELRAAEAERSLPTLSLERVLITPTGHARLIDWGAGASNTALEPIAFLREVARRSLAPGPLPLPARRFLTRLQQGTFDSVSAVHRELAELVDEPAAARRSRRIGHAVLCLAPTLVAGMIMLISTLVIMYAQTADRQRASLSELLMRLERLERQPESAKSPDEKRALEIHLAAVYADAVRDPRTWTEGWTLLRFNPQLRKTADRVLAAQPNPTPEERVAAARVAEPFLEDEHRKAQRMTSVRGVIAIAAYFVAGGAIVTAVFGLLSALLFRGGLMLRLFGMAVSTETGEAPRLRAFWRAVIAWSPAALAGLGLYLGSKWGPAVTISWLLLIALAAALFLTGIVIAIRRPEQGLQDRLAGTWLVPR